jgi:yecA family protein
MAICRPHRVSRELQALQQLLQSDRVPPGTMELSQLDGFLTALVVGPEFIAPGAWVPVVWGGEDAAFENPKQAGQVVNTIMRRYREIIRLVQKHPESYAPISGRAQMEKSVQRAGRQALSPASGSSAMPGNS